ncbi:MAG: FAD-dependent oxidoreductase [Roseiarcus sp.]
MATSTDKINVAVVGGGIAGLTAALRLAQNGCKVTVYEKNATVGGNLGGAQDQHGKFHDVYPHMFGDWYNNFWKLVAELGLSLEHDFDPRPTCAFLKAGEFPKLKLLTNNGSPESALANLTSGIIPVPDMFLAAYSLIDLMSQNFSGGALVNEQTVNGFMTSRPYVTERMLEMHNIIISNIWAVDSYLTSAFAYQSFAKYQFRRPTPQCWVLKGDAYTKLILPLVEKLKALGCEIKTNATVRHVQVSKGRVDRICISDNDHVHSDLQVDNLILAVPPIRLAQLVMSAETDHQSGTRQKAGSAAARHRGDPIVSLLPNLSELRRIHSEPIPVYDVAFNRRLPEIPNYYVSLLDSLFEMTFVDVSQTTAGAKNTVLAVAVSDFYRLPDDNVRKAHLPSIGHSNDFLSEQAQQTAKFLILKELNRYVPFKLGEKWQDENSDIDWEHSFYHSNEDHPLFINEVGSREWSPKTWDARLPNLYFAGDYCINQIDIATVEAGVVSGLQAAQELARNERLNAKIELILPDVYPESAMALWKIALAPYAAAAKCWSDAQVIADRLADGAGLRGAVGLPGDAASMLAETVTKASEAMIESWKAALSFLNPKRR